MPILVVILFVILVFGMAPSLPQPHTFRADLAFAVDLFHGPILAPVWIGLSFVEPKTLRYFEVSATPTGAGATIFGMAVWITMLVGTGIIHAAIGEAWTRRETRRYANKKGRIVVDLDGNTYERWP